MGGGVLIEEIIIEGYFYSTGRETGTRGSPFRVQIDAAPPGCKVMATFIFPPPKQYFSTTLFMKINSFDMVEYAVFLTFI